MSPLESSKLLLATLGRCHSPLAGNFTGVSRETVRAVERLPDTSRSTPDGRREAVYGQIRELAWFISVLCFTIGFTANARFCRRSRAYAKEASPKKW